MRKHFQKLLSILCVIVLFASLAAPAFAVEGEYLASSDNFQTGWYHYSNTGVTNGTATFGSVDCLTRDLSIPAEGSQTRVVGYFTVSPTEAKRVYKLVFGVRGFRDTGLPNTTGVSLSIKYIDNQTNDSIELFTYSSSKYWGDLNQHIEKVITLPESFGSTGKIFYECISKSTTTPVRLCIYGLTITDDTTKDLDASLDKFGERLENAGSNEPALDTDISAFQSAIDTMNGWLDQLDVFADSIDAAGQTANEYIRKGTEIFNGFMSVAPAAVIALVAFGVVFIVVRKIVGR